MQIRRSPIPERSSTNFRSLRRRAFSLVELMVVIALLALIMTLTGTSIHLLLRSEKVVSQSLVTERTISRLAVLFRDDIHQAETATEVSGESGLTTELQLGDESGVHVQYVMKNNQVTRALVEDGKIVGHDDYRLPECRVSVTRIRDVGINAFSLMIERPATLPQLHAGIARPLRKLEILASLDQRKRLLSDQPSPPQSTQPDPIINEAQQ